MFSDVFHVILPKEVAVNFRFYRGPNYCILSSRTIHCGRILSAFWLCISGLRGISLISFCDLKSNTYDALINQLGPKKKWRNSNVMPRWYYRLSKVLHRRIYRYNFSFNTFFTLKASIITHYIGIHNFTKKIY